MGLLIGVTGAIGAGKSTACRMLAAAGRAVLSADLLAREVMEGDEEVVEELRAAFGPKIVGADGRPDRAALARQVFSRPRDLARLNAIVHPRVFAELERRIEALPPGRREPYVVIEAALIFETGMEKTLDYVVVVQASEAVRMARVTARDNAPDADVRKRMRAQMPPSQKAELADFLIENDGGEADLKERVLFIDRLLVTMASTRVPAPRRKPS